MEYYARLLSFGEGGWGTSIAHGVLITISLALATLPFGLLIGFLVALGQQSKERSVRLAAGIYTTVFRGLPELLTMFLIYFGAQIGLEKLVAILGIDARIEINSFAAGMLALGVVFSSYASEVFLSAFRAIPAGQYEAGYAIGLSNRLTMRKIILPQLTRIALPGLANLWMVLLKDTSFISVIGLADIMRQTGIAARVTKEAFLFYGIACLLYLALAIISSFFIIRIENWAYQSQNMGKGRA
ncbi:ABC transporter permease [Phyllobacterium leguminum]|uniref:Amino acid ABC transporter membrane protein 1 (PAAT family) n=1 Tax=Phyllobacterium leguminum TaxID=314237 RepID=A0A318T5H8_9HYPH|nr:ABC transporter permease [Phyllobacterium leguminum]PYE88282.1 amino acid ABC transporter membrane protein 1 (PAAT family) [Phyllobacterium leguminum]